VTVFKIHNRHGARIKSFRFFLFCFFHKEQLCLVLMKGLKPPMVVLFFAFRKEWSKHHKPSKDFNYIVFNIVCLSLLCLAHEWDEGTPFMGGCSVKK
jgi:hypothetical protein